MLPDVLIFVGIKIKAGFLSWIKKVYVIEYLCGGDRVGNQYHEGAKS